MTLVPTKAEKADMATGDVAAARLRQRAGAHVGVLLCSQALVQLVSVGSSLLALAMLPLREVGLLSVQVAVASWLYFTHFGSLNHLYTELPLVYGSEDRQLRLRHIQTCLGAILVISLPVSAVAAAVYYMSPTKGASGAEQPLLFVAAVTAVLGGQWQQIRECSIKAQGNPIKLARWNLLISTAGLIPLALLKFLPPFVVFLFRTTFGFFLVFLYSMAVDGLTFVKPRFSGFGAFFRGGAGLVFSQAVNVLVIQGERLLMAHRYSATTVGSMQLYFLAQTGVQLIPITAINVWFPHARRDQSPGCVAKLHRRAITFTLVLLSIASAGSMGLWFVLQHWPISASFAAASKGLLLAAEFLPAYAFCTSLLVYMARDTVKEYVGWQLVILAAQCGIYLWTPATLPVSSIIQVRGLCLYIVCILCVITAHREALRPSRPPRGAA